MDAVQIMPDGNPFDPSSNKQWMFHWVMGLSRIIDHDRYHDPWIS